MRQTLKDIDDVSRIVGDPSIFLSAKDDCKCTPLQISIAVLRDPNYFVIKPYEDTLFLFKPFNCITYEIHVAIVKGPGRNRGLKSAVEALDWLWENTPAKKIISWIPLSCILKFLKSLLNHF